MKFHRLLALSALSLPAAVSAQYWQGPAPMPAPRAVPPAPPAAASPLSTTVDEPWMAQPPPMAVPSGQAWQSPMAQSNKSTALEPIDLPPAIEQGVDMIYVDESLVPKAAQQSSLLHDISFDDWSGAPLDMFVSMNPIYTELRRGLVK